MLDRPPASGEGRSPGSALIGSVLTDDVEGLTDAVLALTRATRPVTRAELGEPLIRLVRTVIGVRLVDIRLEQIIMARFVTELQMASSMGA